MRRARIELDTVVSQGRLPGSTRVDHRRESMSLELTHRFGFDRIGSRIWQIIEEPCSVDALCDRVSREFGLEYDACLNEIVDFLGHLLRDRLVRVA